MTNFSSEQYWKERYVRNGNSGAGSYGRLADFKAAFINSFVELNQIKSVIEFGCGDGNQLSLLSVPSYTGLDVSDVALERCRARNSDRGYHFINYADLATARMAELGMSIDVVFHLVEDGIFEKYIRDLFSLSEKYAIIYSSDYDNAWPDRHVRHRFVSDYIQKRHPEWSLLARIPNLYPFDLENPNETSFCDFMVFGRGHRSCQLFVPGPSQGDL
ncbi:class I SAM-dependent methyltransferase [Xanthobacter sediminis]